MTIHKDFFDYDPNLQLETLSQGELLDQLRQTRHLYEMVRHIISDSQDGLFITNGQGDVILVNRSYEVMSGVSEEEILGKNMRELEGWTISQSASLKALETREPVTIFQEYLRTHRHAYITSTPIFDDQGEIIMVVSNNRDFKEIERLRQALDAANLLAQSYQSKVRTLVDKGLQSGQFIAQDPATYQFLYQSARVSKADSTVLIRGETGTGKEEVAKFIHRSSDRRDKPFIRINCGAISKELIQSELFGYEKGAFTGAASTGHLGFFEVADSGTLFLDEIGEMPLDLQVKLLRALQEGEIVRVGGTKPIPVDVRILAATNRDLLEMVKAKQFREDLYYRLSVVSIELPPLRNRPGDIPVLMEHFLDRYNGKFRVKRSFSPSAHQVMQQYNWPGNVRELKNVVEQLVLMGEEDVISREMLTLFFPRMVPHQQADTQSGLKRLLAHTEHVYIQRCYQKTGSLTLTAQELGMNLKTLSRRKKQLEELFREPDSHF